MVHGTAMSANGVPNILRRISLESSIIIRYLKVRVVAYELLGGQTYLVGVKFDASLVQSQCRY